MGWNEVKERIAASYTGGEISSDSYADVNCLANIVLAEFPQYERHRVVDAVQIGFMAILPPRKIEKYITCLDKLLED